MGGTIMLARQTDAWRMLAIYEPVVRETAISFELEPPTEAESGGATPLGAAWRCY